jgi:Na+/H+ antiporter NhaD/arsenite permease-like protein
MSHVACAPAGAADEALACGALVGAEFGSALTTFDSLATMLRLASIRQRGLDGASRASVPVALATTPLVLTAATLALWLTFR